MSSSLSTLGTQIELQTFIESTGVAYSDSVYHNRVYVLIIPKVLLACMLVMFLRDEDYYYYVWIFNCAHIQIFYLTFFITAFHIVFISILGLLNRSL